MSKKILVADDNEEIRELINIYLLNEGFEPTLAVDGNEAFKLVDDSFDFVILDIMMPGMDGIEVCKKIREHYSMPILFLTAKREDIDKIIGLASGADDYLVKPFNPLELMARVKSGIRRYRQYNTIQSKEQNNDEIQIDDMTINLATHEVKIEDQCIHLTKTEFNILSFLARHRGMVFSVDRIYQNVWGEECIMNYENTVIVHIRAIRKKIEKDVKNPQYIKTIWGVGYKIEK